MSDSEDDYMSFKVLVDSKDDVRPSLLFNREKRKMDVFKKKIEASNKRQKSLVELERENREMGLNTAISDENKGFKLLEKMGFKHGESLGKNKSGIKEPIDIVIKQGTSGIGRESHLKEVLNKKQQRKISYLRHYETQFHLANKERKNLAQMRKDFFKAQKICEELDFRAKVKDPIEDFFWTRDTIKKRKKLERDEIYEDTDSSSDDEEFETNISEENLFTLIDYLRKKHLYCIYCVITGIDIKDLEENCPGPYRIDHDDE
ncbi:G patch domain-containing protein 11 [Diorhabda carinulata]|uniref:G patch domain-containing protein 11 n=1 Tax=Diorhabda sublineata TaxID=1163346 RepID=UPI0024E05E57|nr:G patch domain-containing protein 11 [Diorhabda sublineata]XP_057662976.1 G patch domain-containing protein 11 [Diorhabda carinulata]